MSDERMDIDEYTLRGSSLIPHSIRETPITIVGVGGLGSWVGVALGKMGALSLELIDPDIVSAVNVGPQAYSPGDVGKPKVLALADQISVVTGRPVIARWARVGGGQGLTRGGIVISLPDSMSARRGVYEAARESGARWLVDGRMGGSSYRVHTCALRDPQCSGTYERSLYSDAQASELPCTARATAYVGLSCGGLIAGIVSGILAHEQSGGEMERPPGMIAWEFPSWGGYAWSRHPVDGRGGVKP